MFSLNCIPQILRAKSLAKKLLFLVKKLLPYDPTLNHNTSVTDGRTDRHTTTRAIAVARQSLKREESRKQVPKFVKSVLTLSC